jgi:hypothetical protein
MIFTRYLYIKEEVECALLISLLKRDANSARFWSEELAEECEDTLLEIFFNFYFTNNFDLMIDLNDLLSTKYEYNLDIYLLRKYVEELDEDDNIDEKDEEDEEDEDSQNFPIWLKERNYKLLAKYILRDCEEVILPYILKHIGTNIKEFNSIIKMIGNNNGSVKKYNRTIYLCFTMKYLLGLDKREKEKKESKESISITIKDIEEIEAVKPYFDVDVSGERGWQKLELVQRYAIDKYDYLCIFSKNRKDTSREELLDRYRNHWLYYASFSLLWKERIEKYKGIISLEKRNVTFAEETDLDDDLLQEFYSLYGLEPDEQSVIVQNKSIPILSLDKEYIANRWSEFCKEFTGNGLVI